MSASSKAPESTFAVEMPLGVVAGVDKARGKEEAISKSISHKHHLNRPRISSQKEIGQRTLFRRPSLRS